MNLNINFIKKELKLKKIFFLNNSSFKILINSNLRKKILSNFVLLRDSTTILSANLKLL